MAINKKKKEKRHLLYEMFNPKGNGKGLTKEEAAKPRTAGRFFGFYTTNFNIMFALNIFAFLGNFPILFGLYALTGNLNINTTSPASTLFAPFHGATLLDGFNPISAALNGIHGVQAEVSMLTTTTKVFFALTLLLFLTFGLVNTATAYIMRNIVKGDPTMFVTDMKYSIKRNLRQGFLLGIIDLLFILVIGYDLLFFYAGMSGPVASFMFGMMLIMAMLYIMMRSYMYVLLVTFDLSIFKILKNSFIFAILGFKRNIVAFLSGIAVWILDYILMTIIFPVGIIMPVLFLVSLTTFMGIYAAYPNIKKFMIDPYYVSDEVGAKEIGSDDGEEEELPEPIFKDRG